MAGLMLSGSPTGLIVVELAPAGLRELPSRCTARGVRAGPHLGQPHRPRRLSPECPWGCPVGLHGWPRTGLSRSGDGDFGPSSLKRPLAGRCLTPRGQSAGDGRECKFALCSFAVSQHAIRWVMFQGDVDGTRPQVPCRLEIPALSGLISDNQICRRR